MTYLWMHKQDEFMKLPKRTPEEIEARIQELETQADDLLEEAAALRAILKHEQAMQTLEVLEAVNGS